MKNILSLVVILCIGHLSFGQRHLPAEPRNSSRTSNGFQPLNITSPDVPKNFTLFGERVPVEILDVRERFDRELLTNTYMQTSTTYIIKHMARYMPMIERKLKENNIPDDFKYLCVAESALRNQVSHAGAAGFWQFLKGTAPGYGLYIDNEVDQRYDPEKSTDAACKYLRQGYNRFGNWTAAAASYNCGMGGYNRRVTEQGESNFYNLYLPNETMRYVFRIAALKYILDDYKAMGFNILSDDQYHPIPTRKVYVNYSLGNLATWAKSQGTNYKTLKFLNPWLRNKSFYNKKKRGYTILLPK